MAGRKEYELLLKLKAALGGNFNSSFQTAISTTKKLQDSLTDINKVQKDVSSYTKQRDAITATKNKAENYAKEHETLQNELVQTIIKEKDLQAAVRKAKKNVAAEQDVETYKKLSAEHEQLQRQAAETTAKKRNLESQLRENKKATEQTTQKIEEQENSLAELSEKLKEAGINTENLTEENDKLQKTYDDLKKSQENFARANSDLEKNKQAISATKTELVKTIGATTALGAAIYVPVKGAMEFESSMAEVAKVVDWIGNGNNATAEQIQQYNELSDGLYGLTRQIPLTAKEFAEIAAAAGQANVAMDNASLLTFASDAAKMGVAFDISAEQAGDWMAKWRTSFQMTQEQVVELADKINYLGNTTPATAAQISNVVTRIGPLGEVAGLASGDIAALAASIVGVGIGEDVAATGIKNLMLDMTKGTATTKKMNQVLESMGVDASDLANRMQTDATGAIMDFMRALQQLPAAEQAAALNNYFGQESVGAIAPLLSNLGMLEEQFNKVADAQTYAGSMEGEYAARAATSENTVQLMKNAIKELSDTFGNIFVPNAESGAQALTEVIYKVTDFVKENGETIKIVTAVVGGLLAAKTAYLGVKTVVLSVMGVYKAIKVAMAAYQVAQAAMAAGTGVWAAVSAAATTPTAALGAAMAAVSLPVVAVVAAIATVIAIVVLLVKHWDKVKEVAGTVWEAVKSAFGKVGEFFSGLFDKIKAPFVIAINWVKENWKQIVLFILNPFAGIFSYLYKHFEGFRNFINSVVEKIKAIFGAIVEWFSQNVIQPIINIFGPVVQKIGEIFAKLWEIITVLFGVLATWFKDKVVTPVVEFFKTLISAVSGIFKSVWDAITGVFATVAEWFSAKFTAAWEAIKVVFAVVGTVFQGIWESIKTVFSNVSGWFSEKFTAAWEAVKSVFSTVGAFFKGIWDSIVSIFTSIGTAVGNAIGDAFKFVVNSIIGFAEGLINKFISGINRAIGLINNIPGVSIELLTELNIPKLEKGSNYTPDTFIAGDVNGKGGELVTGARGRKVFTAAQTDAIFANINKAKAFNSVKSMPTPFNLSPRGGEQKFTIQYSPTIYVDGNKPGDLEEKLRQNNEALLEIIKEYFRQQRENERRMAYA